VSNYQPKSDTKGFMVRVERTIWILSLVALAVTGALAGFGEHFNGVLAGGVIIALNWRAVMWLALHLMGQGKRSKSFYAALAGAKFALLLGVISLVLAVFPVSRLGFLVGVSTLLPATIGNGLLAPPSFSKNEGQC
jgi:hypothetical protein